MSAPIWVCGVGLVTSVGLTAASSCAALRAKVANPTPTAFFNRLGQHVMAHQVPWPQPLRGMSRWVQMAVAAATEALDGVPRDRWAAMPLLLCVAEPQRPGRAAQLEQGLLDGIQRELGVQFAPGSVAISQGQASVAVAMAQARALCQQGRAKNVLIVAVDSLLQAAALDHFEQHDRLLTATHSNGFMPGEAAGALYLSAEKPAAGPSWCMTGFGYATEPAVLGSDEPLRAEGLTQAVKLALGDAERAMHELDWRVTDLTGEHYYFKEAALALARTLSQRKEVFDIWHPAECVGACGAALGAVMVAWLREAGRKGYAPGTRALCHAGNDAGLRVAWIMELGPH